MLVTLASRRWRLLFANPGKGNDGICDSPSTPRKSIKIRPSLRRYPARLVEVVIHECLHAEGWPLDEDFVGQAAEDIARVLDRLGLIKEELPRESGKQTQ